jgi:hypothetical protein
MTQVTVKTLKEIDENNMTICVLLTDRKYDETGLSAGHYDMWHGIARAVLSEKCGFKVENYDSELMDSLSLSIRTKVYPDSDY